MKFVILATIFGAVVAFAPPSQSGRFASPPMHMVSIQSKNFPGRYLRMDGNGVIADENAPGGVVNCQGFVGPYEQFDLLPQLDGSVAIQSKYFPGRYLRMDGNGVIAGENAPGGVVNCQGFTYIYEKFNLLLQADGSVAIQSKYFPSAYLRMDGNGVIAGENSPGGIVNCQGFVGPYEKFFIV
jgi:hypothetical protein